MDLLQQFADRLDSAFDAAGVDAIEDNAGTLTELAASPVIRAAVARQPMDIMDLQTEVIPAGCNDAAIHPWVFVPIFVFIPAN